MLRTLLWNTNGYSNKKEQAIKNLIITKKINLIILTETHNSVIKNIKVGWKTTQSKSKNKGITIMYNNIIKNIKIIEKNDRYIQLDINTTKNKWIRCMFIYAPANAKEKKDWWEKNMEKLKKKDLIAGDFNFVFKDSDRIGKLSLNKSTRQKLEKIILDKMEDVAVSKKKEHIKTFKKNSRIDRLYINNKKLTVIKYKVYFNYISNDHHMIMTFLQINKEENWRFQQRLVESEKDKFFLKKELENITVMEKNIFKKWENIKNDIVTRLKKYEKQKYKKKYKHFYTAKFLMKKYPNSKDYSKWNTIILEFIKYQEELDAINADMEQIRTRELPSFFVTNRINKRRKESILPDVVDKEKTALDFYKKLYKRIDIDDKQLNGLLQNFKIPNNNITKIMGEKITIEELSSTISQLKNNSTPGIDGIPGMIYKLLNNHCLLTLNNVLNQCFTEKMPHSWKKGLIILIFKKGDVNDIANYRPITLLNNDYKILCKIMSNRINTFIKKIIENYQIGFMPDRLIYDNILCMDLLIKNKYKIINLDFKKAYDSVSHDAIIQTFTYLQFPKEFVYLLQNLLSESTAKLLVNGELTNKFKIQRGVKQGDPLSPLLFTFIVEILANCSKTNEIKKHIPEINSIPIGYLMYADDTCLVSKTTEGANIWFEQLDNFRRSTGLEINISKTFGINYGKEEIKQIQTNFRYLGFTFNPVSGVVDDFDEEIDKAVKKLKKLTSWKHNIHMKLTLLKCYILSALWFKGFIIGKTSKILNNTIKRFLWITRNKKIKTLVSMKRATKSINEGGLGVWDLQIRFTALKASMWERIIFNEDMKIHNIMKDSFADNIESITESSILNNLYKCWKACKADTVLKMSYHNVKEIQEILYEQRYKPKILTKKQQLFNNRYNSNTDNIFKNINRLGDLNLRAFAWKYFQGALGFDHKQKCTPCNVNLTHEHIFFKCKKTERIRKQADNALLLFRKKKKTKMKILWNEKFLWNEMSTIENRAKKLRELMLISLHSMWIELNSDKKDTIVKGISKHIRSELEITKLIAKEEDRTLAEEKLRNRWSTNSLFFRSNHYFELTNQTKQKIINVI